MGPSARLSRRALWTGLLLCCALSVLLALLGVVDGWIMALVAWGGTAVAFGDALRSRRAYAASAAERERREALARDEEARRRVAEERLRIARELHDVVAHQIALANVQASVAAHVMDRRPDQARQALTHAREASRSALDELRATVGLLRLRGEPDVPMEPAPGLGLLDQLLDGFRREGLQVTVECLSSQAGGPAPEQRPPLPVSVDLTAYRVIQESLTNVRKHAGPGAGAVVRIRRESGALEVVVDDDGTSAVPAASGVPAQKRAAATAAEGPAGGGHGLLGMYERANALGGVCRAGARPGGGFRVWVRLPLAGRPYVGAPAEGA
ncbi:sensor histidine kinase [Streptomyces sp. NPDC004031]